MSKSPEDKEIGWTSLLFGRRVSKTHPRVETTGALDELNAVIGICRAHCREVETASLLRHLQGELVQLMGEIATDSPDQDRYLEGASEALGPDHLDRLRARIKDLEGEDHAPRGWAFPGDSTTQAFFDQARTVCRRAERQVIALADSGEAVRPVVIEYLNLLGKLLWLLGCTQIEDR